MYELKRFKKTSQIGALGQEDRLGDRRSVSPRGLADDELRVEGHVAMLMVLRRLGLFQQECGGGPSQQLAGLADRGQGHRGGRCELDVVIPDDREIARNRQALLRDLLQHSESKKVVGAEDGRGAGLPAAALSRDGPRRPYSPSSPG